MLIGQEFNQSMEIDIQKGNYTTIDGQKTYEIQNLSSLHYAFLVSVRKVIPRGM